MKHGLTVTSPPSSRELADALTRSLGDENMQDRGLTLGDGSDGSLVGKLDAVFVSAVLPASSADVTVRHNLGRTPVLAIGCSVKVGPSGDSVVALSVVGMSATTLTVHAHSIAGTMTGAVATFIVA